MSTIPDPQREQPGTYAVQDRSSEEEMQRLRVQDRLINLSLGGLLPEQSDPARFTRVLDVGCGTGGWLIELAKTYPTIKKLIGVDVSSKMLAFARAQADAEGVGDRVEFLLMDALRMLEFPGSFFDLVNHRLAISWLRTWDWSKLLQEYLRVARPDGVIRVTEVDWGVEQSNSPALTQLTELLWKTGYRSGHLFSPDNRGATSELAYLLRRHGVQQVQTRAYTLHYRAGTVEGELLAQDMAHLFRTMKPFIQKWIRLPDDYEQIYRQMIAEIHQPDFTATANLLTAWGTKL